MIYLLWSNPHWPNWPGGYKCVRAIWGRFTGDKKTMIYDSRDTNDSWDGTRTYTVSLSPPVCELRWIVPWSLLPLEGTGGCSAKRAWPDLLLIQRLEPIHLHWHAPNSTVNYRARERGRGVKGKREEERDRDEGREVEEKWRRGRDAAERSSASIKFPWQLLMNATEWV